MPFILQIYGKTLTIGRFSPFFYFCTDIYITFSFDSTTIMEYLEAEFTITCPDGLLQTARDLLADAAATSGFDSFEDTYNGMRGYVQSALFDEEELKTQLSDFLLPNVNVSYTIRKAEDKDWNQTWEDNGFDPIDIDNGKMLVVDANHCDNLSLPKAGKVIKIDAKLAFGTGTHETTQMIISTLLDLDESKVLPLNGLRVLDCGCGTGILGIAASMLGASEVIGYDIDEWSVKNTLHNAELNSVDNVKALLGDASVIKTIEGQFDIVLANINRNILLQDMAEMRAKMAQDAILILSGFYESDIPLLVAKAEELGLGLMRQKGKSDWRCLVLKAL